VLIASAVLGVLAAIVPTADASVILLGPVLNQPSGIGVVNTLLSIQSQGNATDETGRTSWNGTTSVATGLPNPAGAAQPGVNTTTIATGGNNQARLFSDLGLTQASDLRVFFNINEPPPQSDVILRSLIFTAYNAGGTAVFTAALPAPLMLDQVHSGIGIAGYVFSLDSAEAAQLQAVFSPTLRLGIEASINNAQGGFDTFFATSVQTVGPGPFSVPEPGTLALMGLGLGGLAFLRRKKTD